MHLAPLPAWTGRPGWARHEAVQASAADTGVDPEPLLGRVGEKRPYWLPGSLVCNL